MLHPPGIEQEDPKRCASSRNIMAKVAIEDRIYSHETKPQPIENPPWKIVEAFGLGKCPKLVEQVGSENRQ